MIVSTNQIKSNKERNISIVVLLDNIDTNNWFVVRQIKSIKITKITKKLSFWQLFKKQKGILDYQIVAILRIIFPQNNKLQKRHILIHQN